MHFIFTAIFLLTHVSLVSQANESTVDSLQRILKTKQHDTMRYKTLVVMGDAYQNIDLDTALQYHLRARQLAVEMHDGLKEGEATQDLVFDYLYLADYRSALAFCEEAITISDRLIESKEHLRYLPRISRLKARCLGHKGLLYKEMGEYEKALENLFFSLKLSKQYDNKDNIAVTFANIGSTYYNQGNYIKALEYNFSALRQFESLKIKGRQAYVLGNIGLIYSDQRDHENALANFFMAVKILEELNDLRGVGVGLTNIASEYLAMNDEEKTHEYINKALKVCRETKNRENIATNLCNLGVLYDNKRNYNEAIKCYHESIKIYDELGDTKGALEAKLNLGGLYVQTKRIKKAENELKGCIKIATELGSTVHLEQANFEMSNLFEQTNKYALALKHYKQYILYRDSVLSVENTKATIRQQIKFSFERKAAADSVKTADEKRVAAALLSESEANLKQQKTQRLALSGGLILVIVFAGFMFNRFKVTQKQKYIIEVKEQETQRQNITITEQKNLVEEKHKEITDSINYAERIQRALLASKNLLDKNIKEYFILFKPKDVVSGDFYWASTLKKGNFVLVTADSTGHGVPGAIMSILNMACLKEAVVQGIQRPDLLLNETRRLIIESLANDGSAEGGKDGMDASAICFDFKNKKLTCAIAFNSVWIVRGSEVIEIDGDRMPVGKHSLDTVPFTLHTVDLKPGDVVYTFTDGYADQFGGPKLKKFMYKKLKELLLRNSQLNMAEQKLALENEFDAWKGALEQVDDVTIIGVRV